MSIVRDLTDDAATRSVAAALNYENCCFKFETSFTRNFFEDRDIEPTDSVTLRLTFKTIGAVASQVR
jgi:LPS-assembly protein